MAFVMPLPVFYPILLLLFGGGPSGVNSLTQVRPTPNFIRLEVPHHLEAGADLLRLNGSSESYRYLIANQDHFANQFFLANGQTLTTLGNVDLPSEANVSLSVLEEGPHQTRVIPIEIHVISNRKMSFHGKILENQPSGTPVAILEKGWPLSSPAILAEGEIHNSAIFELNNENGEVLTKMPLDRERQAHYELKVISNTNPSHVLAVIDVEVENVNDNLPVFNITSTKLLWKVNPIGMRKYSILGKTHSSVKI